MFGAGAAAPRSTARPTIAEDEFGYWDNVRPVTRDEQGILRRFADDVYASEQGGPLP